MWSLFLSGLTWCVKWSQNLKNGGTMLVSIFLRYFTFGNIENSKKSFKDTSHVGVESDHREHRLTLSFLFLIIPYFKSELIYVTRVIVLLFWTHQRHWNTLINCQQCYKLQLCLRIRRLCCWWNIFTCCLVCHLQTLQTAEHQPISLLIYTT